MDHENSEPSTSNAYDYCETKDNEGSVMNKKAENNLFGSHVLSSNSMDSDKPESLCSFAKLSEKYKKSRCNVILPEGSVPSTLSMISENYQDSSSDDDTSIDESNNSEHFVDSDDESKLTVSKGECDVKTKGELNMSDLPPIEDLKISVEESECEPVGCVKNIVDTLVVVEAFLNKPALDIDSVLFIDRGQRTLGRVFDVFGPVTKPYYAVRFNDSDHIKSYNIQIKEPVYCAPKTEYASFVMVSQLLNMKGSDASWKDNNEPPADCVDYSDDEAEKLAKKSRKQKKRLQKNDKKDNLPAPSTTPDIHQDNDVEIIEPPSAWPHNDGQQMHNAPSPPVFNFNPTNYGYGRFPTYAQYLRAMDHSHHAYRQPQPFYYGQMYPPERYSYHQQNGQQPRYNFPQQPF